MPNTSVKYTCDRMGDERLEGIIADERRRRRQFSFTTCDERMLMSPPKATAFIRNATTFIRKSSIKPNPRFDWSKIITKNHVTEHVMRCTQHSDVDQADELFQRSHTCCLRGRSCFKYTQPSLPRVLPCVLFFFFLVLEFETQHSRHPERSVLLGLSCRQTQHALNCRFHILLLQSHCCSH